MDSRNPPDLPGKSRHASSASPVRHLAICLGLAALLLAGLTGCNKESDNHAAATPPQAANTVSSFPIAEPALSKAVIAGNLNDVRKLLAAGGDVNTKDTLDRTPLHLAAFYGRPKTIELLLASGADVNAKDHTALTPLHAAVISGGRQAVQLLLDHQADLQATNGAGQTALHLAASTGQPKLTKFLIDRGADLNKRDFDGRAPLYYAKKNYHPKTAAVLEQALAAAAKQASAGTAAKE